MAGVLAGSSAVVTASIILVTAVFVGVAVAVVLSVIPSYTTSHSVTPNGEKYCLNNLTVNVTFNSSTLNGYTKQLSTNYPLSQACYRILNNYYSDSQLSSCLMSNCSLDNTTFTTANVIVPSNIICTSTIVYYSVRCTDQGILSGLYNYITSSGNSNCRKTRMARINAALGASSSTQYTNVQTFILNNTAVVVNSLYSEGFTTYSQAGVQYCGSASTTDIATAVNAQSSG